jgi:hypothetical protein
MGCARCGTDAVWLEKAEDGLFYCPDCLKKTRHQIYNRKAFLVPDSIHSMAAYHAKIFPDGKYIFRIHDCNTGIRLRGDLNDGDQIHEAIEKLRTLENALFAFKKHIIDNYTVKEFP